MQYNKYDCVTNDLYYYVYFRVLPLEYIVYLKKSNRLGWLINYQTAVFHSTKEQRIADCQLFRPISLFLEKTKLFNKSLTRLSFL